MKKHLEILIAIMIGAVLVTIIGNPFSTRERRFTLYNLMRDLHVGMRESEIESVIERHNTPFIRRYDEDNTIILHASLGNIDSCILTINKENGVLISARIRGEDGPHEFFKDAPKDIKTIEPLPGEVRETSSRPSG